jgi:predicted  nucleic acid-binding Zn-ribbon protein
VNTIESIVLLTDLDAMIREAQSPDSRARLRKLGLDLEGLPRVMAARGRLAEGIERRWTIAYERTRQRYGRAVAAVRERVCSGCFVTLPTTARPRPGDAAAPQHCESCGRILYWS